jgi:hypothetical protein
MNKTVYDPNDPYCVALPSKRRPMPFTKKYTLSSQMPSKPRKALPSHRIDKMLLEMIPLFLHFLIFDLGAVILFVVLLIALIVFAYIILFDSSLLFIKI